MPHLSDIFAALWGSASPGGVGPRLITVLVKGALFTAKEAAAGFAIGALVGFSLGVVLAQFRLLQRGLLPWVVASQTVPILVVAPERARRPDHQLQPVLLDGAARPLGDEPDRGSAWDLVLPRNRDRREARCAARAGESCMTDRATVVEINGVSKQFGQTTALQ